MRAGKLPHWLLGLLLLCLQIGAAELRLRPPENTDQTGIIEIPGVVDSFRLPKIDGLIWLRPDQSLSISNRGVSGRTVLKFQITQPGKCQIPELKIPLQDGDTAVLPPQSFEVRAGEMMHSLRLKVLFGKNRSEQMPGIFLGEEIDVTMELLIRDDYDISEESVSPELTLPGTSFLQSPEQNPSIERNLLIDKRLWTKLILKGRVKAILPGRHEGNASASLMARPRGNSFAGYLPVSTSLSSGSYEIKKLPPVPAGVEFLNLVGDDFDLGLSLAPGEEMQSSDSCYLILSVRSKDDLSVLKLPEWRFLGFQNLTHEKIQVDNGVDVTWTLVPDGGGVKIPEIAVASFDPAKGEYQVKRFTPRLKVLGPPPPVKAESSVAAPQRKPLPSLPLGAVSSPPGGLGSLLLFLAAPVLLLILQWRPGRFWRRLQARRRRASLAQRLDAGDASAAAELEVFLRELWSLPPGADLAAAAELRGERDFAGALRQFTEARFAPRPAAALPELGRSLRLLPLLLFLISSAPLFAAEKDPGRAAYGRAENAWSSGDAAATLAELDLAQELMPRCPEIGEAIEQARLAAGPQASAPGAIVQLRDRLHPGEWLLLAASLWFAAWLAAATLKRRGQPWRAALALGLLAAALPFSCAWAQSAGSRASGRAVAAAEIQLRESADGRPSGDRIAAGSLVLLRQTNADGSWAEVREIHGEGRGWTQIRELRRAKP
ncbi:MAG: hypothetical protein RL095_2973 [Verrucomicrobiota bacterium]|jgi:hypothetical protein